MARYQALEEVVAMVQATISRKANGRPVTVIEALKIMAQDGSALLLVAAFFLSGCGNESTSTDEPRLDPPSTNGTPQEEKTIDNEIETIVDAIMSTPEGRAAAQRVHDRDEQLTQFQRANGISDKVAEAAIMEWVVGHGGNFDWDLEDVKAICRRMQRE